MSGSKRRRVPQALESPPDTAVGSGGSDGEMVERRSTRARKTAKKEAPAGEETSVVHLTPSQIKIEPGRNPRQDYDEEGLKKLSYSLKHVGMLQPLVVRTKENDSNYYLVAGERRLRAAKRIKMKTVPAVVHELMTDARVTYTQYAENAMRQDLNPVEVAQSLNSFLGQEIEMTISEEDEKTGKVIQKTITRQVNAKLAAEIYSISQGKVSQYLGLLKLPEEIQKAIRSGEMSFAQARELQGKDTKDQLAVLDGIQAGELKRAADVREVLARKRAKKATSGNSEDAEPEGKRRGRPSQTSAEAPSVRQGLETALERLRVVKLTPRSKPELREGLAMTYEKHERAKTEEKKHFYKGFAAALEWMGGLRDKL